MKKLWTALGLGLLMGFASAQDTTITVAAGAVGQELELTRAAAERYMEQNPDVTVEVLETPDLADDRLSVYLQLFEAQSPDVDVMQIDVIWPGDLEQHFVDLYEYGADEVVDEHFDAIVENNTVDGKLVAIPWFTDAGLLYYRSDLLGDYGFDGPPQTWTELEYMASVIQAGERSGVQPDETMYQEILSLQDQFTAAESNQERAEILAQIDDVYAEAASANGNQDFWGYVWQGNSYEGLTCDALEWVASNDGGTIVSPDGVITINNQNAIDIVEQAAGWVGTISPSGVTSMDEEGARNTFQAGNAAFMRNWPYAYALAQGEDSAVAGNVEVAPLPAGEEGEPAHTLGGWQLGVSAYSENPEVAADVALFLASYEEQKIRAVEGSLNPTIEALYEDEDVLEAVPFFGDLYDVFVNAVPRPSTVTAPRYAEVSRAFYTAVHSVLTGQEDAETALAIAELDIEAITGLETGDPQ